MTDFPEANAVAWTNVKTTNGYHWSFTMRAGTVNDLVKQIDDIEKVFIQKKWIAEEIRGSGFPKKEKEYIPDRKCPTCGMRLVKTQKRDGTQYVKCETNKWDAIKQVATGCPYVEWTAKPLIPERDINDI